MHLQLENGISEENTNITRLTLDVSWRGSSKEGSSTSHRGSTMHITKSPPAYKIVINASKRDMPKKVML